MAEQTALGVMTGRLRHAARRSPDAAAEEAVADLLPEGNDLVEYLGRFTWLVGLSAAIASFGLLDDSSAVVIGAMLVAPLMTPILATAAATVRAENRRLLISALILVGGTVMAILVGFVVSAIAGSEIDSSTELPHEISSRTYPQLLDLGIAVTAGAAAGYILPRRSATGALPGVGIAVALVPPLAVVGILLEAGLGGDAGNAFLLYVTNLAAIIFAASVMLLLVGFRPVQRQSRRTLTIRVGITVGAVLAVAIPLSLHTRSTVIDSNLREDVVNAVGEWDETVQIRESQTRVNGDVAEVDLLIAGWNEPRDAWQLAELISDRFGGPVDLQLLYEQDQRFQASVR